MAADESSLIVPQRGKEHEKFWKLPLITSDFLVLIADDDDDDVVDDEKKIVKIIAAEAGPGRSRMNNLALEFLITLPGG